MQILSRKKIRALKRRAGDDAELRAVADMAEKYRRNWRARNRRKKQRPKRYLKPTDYLTVQQFAAVMSVVTAAAAAAKEKSLATTRAVVNEMIVITLFETGLRASELCKLRIKDLPCYHGKQAIEVRGGKGGKDRTVAVSDFLADKLAEFIGVHTPEPEKYLFMSERGGPLKYGSVYSKIKRLGVAAEIWLYRKNGRVKSRLSPHKARHTYATLLLDVSDNEFLVQNQLGHEKPDTTEIYARTLNEKLRNATNKFHNRLWGAFRNDSKANL